MGICISRHAVYHGRLDAMADQSAERLGDPTELPKMPTAAARTSLTDSEVEAMADKLFSVRNFKTSEEVRRYAAGMTGKPGSTPMAQDILPPGLERATQRRIRALAPPSIAE